MKKAAAVTGDDLAVSAGQCHGLPAHREIPVLWKITKGSLLNKAILVVLLLLIDYFVPFLATILLVLGACYIAYEAGEKVFYSGIKEPEHEVNQQTEDELVKGALRTDVVLSAEIMIISLTSIASTTSFEYKAMLLSIIAIIVTVAVYGFVTLLVRLDDMGIALMKSDNSFINGFGRGMANSAPEFMKWLTIIGTLAIFVVAGGIINHVFHLSYMPTYVPEMISDLVSGFMLGMWLASMHALYAMYKDKKSC